VAPYLALLRSELWLRILLCFGLICSSVTCFASVLIMALYLVLPRSELWLHIAVLITAVFWYFVHDLRA